MSAEISETQRSSTLTDLMIERSKSNANLFWEGFLDHLVALYGKEKGKQVKHRKLVIIKPHFL